MDEVKEEKSEIDEKTALRGGRGSAAAIRSEAEEGSGATTTRSDGTTASGDGVVADTAFVNDVNELMNMTHGQLIKKMVELYNEANEIGTRQMIYTGIGGTATVGTMLMAHPYDIKSSAAGMWAVVCGAAIGLTVASTIEVGSIKDCKKRLNECIVNEKALLYKKRTERKTAHPTPTPTPPRPQSPSPAPTPKRGAKSKKSTKSKAVSPDPASAAAVDSDADTIKLEPPSPKRPPHSPIPCVPVAAPVPTNKLSRKTTRTLKEIINDELDRRGFFVGASRYNQLLKFFQEYITLCEVFENGGGDDGARKYFISRNNDRVSKTIVS